MDDATYLSQEKLEELQAELKHRETTLRREIADKIANAKELGDLSENFEYADAKDMQADNETQIIRLKEMIKNAVLVEKRSGEDTIALGTSFAAKLSDGTEKSFEIVGPSETDPINGKISNESPIGKAFLGKRVGEEVVVEIPSGQITYTITNIE